MLAHQDLDTATERSPTDDADYADALRDLQRGAACCSGLDLPAADVGPDRKRRQARKGRHRMAPASRRFVLPCVEVVEPGVAGTSEADVLVADGRIVEVARAGGGPYPGFDVVESLRGHFVAP